MAEEAGSEEGMGLWWLIIVGGIAAYALTVVVCGVLCYRERRNRAAMAAPAARAAESASIRR